MSFWQIWNMCFGFLGLQFGFALQNANASRIFQSLGASSDQLPLLWFAAPCSGLLVQPLVGYFSDRTWTRLGRRRPYFLAGALLAATALVLMPRAPSLWAAAALLWLLDGAFNTSMEPFRAFVGDQLSPAQRPAGYSMQSFFIGAGAIVASVLPWLLEHAGVGNSAGNGSMIPDTVRYAFEIGAAVLLLAIGWTTLASREYSPQELLGFDDALPVGSARAVERGTRAGVLATIVGDLAAMPLAMWRLAPVQFFSWLALFSLWIYTTPAVAQVHFGATDPHSAAYNRGANWVGVLFGAYNGFAALAAAIIPALVRRLGLRLTHLVNVWLGGAALLSFLVISDPHWLLASMIGLGFAWASVLSLPYALLSDSVPAQKMGLYMGVFNVFIVIPQMVAASVLGLLLRVLFGGAPIYALAIGGASFVVAGLLVLRVPQPPAS
jgi:maltose/moltooligosaccharide transporter